MSDKPIDQVLFEGTKVYHHLLLGGPGGLVTPQCEASFSRVSRKMAGMYRSQYKFSLGLVPEGMVIRDVHTENNLHIFLVQIEPTIRTLNWLRDDSPSRYGRDCTYRAATISLPYVYFFITMTEAKWFAPHNSVYFRNAPLTSLDDPLLECAFFNCSVMDDKPLHCWICTQTLDVSRRRQSYAQMTSDFITWFWSSGFNASSEHHEGNSFWGLTREKITDTRLKSIEAWEKATREEGEFACDVQWLPVNLTPNKVYRQLAAQESSWKPTSSAQLAGLVRSASLEERRRS